MKILIHGINCRPELTGIGRYTGEMAEWLAGIGHEVRVVTAPPYYPQWAVAEGYSGWKYVREVHHCPSAGEGSGAAFGRRGEEHIPGSQTLSPLSPLSPMGNGSLVMYRCPLWVPRTPSGMKRLVHLASFALSSLPVMLAQVIWRPNVVLVIEPPLFCAPQAVLVAGVCGGKAWLHIQDFEIDAAFELGLLHGQWVRGAVAAGERWLMRRFDVVSTISERMLALAGGKGVAPGKAVLFPNWVDVAAITPLSGTSPLRAELGLPPDVVVALYSGNMGSKQGLEILPQVATLLVDRPDIQFVFCGNGAGRPDLVQSCAGLANVRFLDLQPEERLNNLLGLADIHLLPQRAGAADLVMPSKLTGMLASGRVILATAGPETQLAHALEGCGLVVPPASADLMAEGLRRLADDAPLRERLGKAGRLYAEQHLDKEQVLMRFLESLQRVCDGVN